MPDTLSNENGVNDSSAAATAVRELLEGVRQGEPLQAGALTLIPLVAASEQVKRQTGYLPLEEALRRKLVASDQCPHSRIFSESRTVLQPAHICTDQGSHKTHCVLFARTPAPTARLGPSLAANPNSCGHPTKYLQPE